MGTRGRPETVSDETLLGIIRESDDPAISTAEITEEVSLSRRCVHGRLSDLVEEGLLESKGKAGGSRIWWLAQPDSSSEAESTSK
jgi:DNA-binding IclR family transcriptional regulator